jgi:hypothetical protein
VRKAFLLYCFAAQTSAQQSETDPRNVEIALLRSRTDLEVADSAYARTRHLYHRQLASAAELELRRADRERAMLTVLERWSALTASTPRLRVMHAFKARSPDGSSVARVRIALSAPDSGALWPDTRLPDELLARLRSVRAREAFISLKDEPGSAGTAIGVPYEQRIGPTAAGGVRDLEFRLLRDVDAVVISLASEGRLDERKVWLEADVSGALTVQPLPFSQEADVGTDAFYDLTIERFGGGDAPVRLVIEGLPPAVAHSFTDTETGVRISQLRFADAEHHRRVRLRLTLPMPDAEAIVVDSVYRFLVIAAPERGDGSAQGAAAAPAARRRAGAGVAELEVVPRGVGRAELRVLNLFHEVAEGKPATVQVTVRNAGSRLLDRARVLVEAPPGWEVVTDPLELRELAPGTEVPVSLTIAAAAGADLGDYEARLRIQGTSGRTRLTTDATVIRVRVQAHSGSLAIGALLGALLLAAAATVILTRRLARR